MNKTLYYSDIIVQESINNHDSDSASIYSISNKIYGVIHGINRSSDNKIAVDFLTKETLVDRQFIIRLFHHDRIWLTGVITELSNHYVIRDYTKITHPARVRKPQSFVVNRRKRVHDKLSVARQSSLRYCQTLLHFHLISKSNNNRYIVSVEQREVGSLIGDFSPNNYGLSTNNVIFALPRF